MMSLFGCCAAFIATAVSVSVAAAQTGYTFKGRSGVSANESDAEAMQCSLARLC
jgi:hypothetical protein